MKNNEQGLQFFFRISQSIKKFDGFFYMAFRWEEFIIGWKRGTSLPESPVLPIEVT